MTWRDSGDFVYQCACGRCDRRDRACLEIDSGSGIFGESSCSSGWLDREKTGRKALQNMIRVLGNQQEQAV